MRHMLLAVAASLGTLAAQGPPAGAVIDPSDFTYAREISPGPAALVELPLDVAVLAHSRGPSAQFADVRIVDDANRQVQYLLEQGVVPHSPGLDVQFRATSDVPEAIASEPGHTRSNYAVELPYPSLPRASLLVSTSETHAFRRTVQASVEHPADRRHRDRWIEVLDTREWTCCNDVPLALSLGARTPASTTILLTLDERDNAPLPITGVRLMLPGWNARFYRPANEPLRLLYGNPEATAPVYDLALMRAKVMKDRADQVLPGPEVARVGEPAAILSPTVFWGFLIAAVLVLIALVVRLATSRPSADPPPPSAPRP